jgi:hypothetical protein
MTPLTRECLDDYNPACWNGRDTEITLGIRALAMSKSWIVMGGSVLLSVITAMGVLPSAFSEECNPLVDHSRNGAGMIILCPQINLLKSLEV